MTAAAETETAIDINDLHFSYENGAPVFSGLNIKIPRGSRTLLAGANGTGKSTLLRLIAGQHLLSPQALRVFGRSPFHELSPSSVAPPILVEDDFPITLDLRVSELIAHRPLSVDMRKEKELIELLEVRPEWRMHQVSSGQRRRVQLLLALRKPLQIILLDEVTTNLDLLVRSDLLEWLRTESENAGLTIVYATHIFDGLWKSHARPWPTHLAFLNFKGLRGMSPVGEIGELISARERGEPAPLGTLCEAWMREDRASRSHLPA